MEELVSCSSSSSELSESQSSSQGGGGTETQSSSIVLVVGNITNNALEDDNILLEILTRLPPKCACRFKSVSKHWNSLISQPYFARRRHRHQLVISKNDLLPLPFTFIFDYSDENRKHHLFCMTTASSSSSSDDDDDEVFKSRGFSLSFLPCYGFPEVRLPIVVASYNDLLLCQTSNLGTPKINYCICNPLTMQWVDLPPAPRPHNAAAGGPGGFRLGLVGHPISQQLIIVRVPDFNNGFSALQRFKLDIFSSHTNQWIKTSGVKWPRGISSCSRTQPNSVACNQTLYWLCDDYLFAYDAFGNNHQDGEDDYRKRCHFIDLPSDYKPHVTNNNNRLGVCQGKLRLSQLLDKHDDDDDHVSEPTLRIWELKEEEEDYNNIGSNNISSSGSSKWCLEHKFVLKELTSETPKLAKKLLEAGNALEAIVMGFHPHDADIVYFHLDVCVVACNIRRKTLELVCEISPRPDLDIFAKHFYPLVQSWWPTPVPTLSTNAAALPS